jgi:hypothetical protein
MPIQSPGAEKALSCPHFVRFSAALPAVALLLAGCANSSNSVANANASTTSTASAAPASAAPAKPQPERFGSYGISNRGYSTNLAAEINSMVTGEDTDAPETKVAAATPAGSVPATAAVTGSGAKAANGASAPGDAAPPQAAGQPQVAQNQDPPKSKAQQAEDNVPGLYGTPRAPQKDVVHWLLETSKDQ